MIAHNSGRKEKALWTEMDGGDKIRLYHALDERDEAAWVCDGIQSLMRKGLPAGDIAILYRTNAQSRVLEEALVRRGIRYGVYGGLKFYDRKEVKDVIAYLRLLINPDDDVSLRRVINEPRRGIGDSTVDALGAYARENDCSMVNAVLDADKISLSARALNAVRAFGDLIVDLTGEMLDLSCADLVEKVLEKTGILKQYENSKDEMDAARVENIKELVAAVVEYDKLNPEEGILGFLENVALVTDTDSLEEKTSVVTLMTLHSAKGLEFPAVFLTGLEENIFPISRAMFDEDQLEEERRLMYVGITRAKRHLFLSHAGNRMLYNARQSNEMSRFVSEIPGRVLEDNRMRSGAARLARPMQRPIAGGNYPKPSLPTVSGKPGLNGIPGLQKGFGNTNFVASKAASSRGTNLFKAGDKVAHRTLGTGTVKQVRQTDLGDRVDVDFGGEKGVRTFPADTAPIIKIG